ncbi:hypothetical protein [Bacillus cereus]|uniref:Phage protein n=1 Tax=Bacillus cereus TaxID=1396 RepID=A0ABD4LLX1_BACCE|nr:hypothetical protein [Bacillus cereus]MBK1611735.1 hypothetical protein [Bacillus cereus]
MNILTWDENSAKKGMSFEESIAVAGLTDAYRNDELPEGVQTKHAMALIMTSLIGDYHAIVVKRSEELLEDAEIYLLTWNEVIEGGDMKQVDTFLLRNLVKGSLFKQV